MLQDGVHHSARKLNSTTGNLPLVWMQTHSHSLTAVVQSRNHALHIQDGTQPTSLHTLTQCLADTTPTLSHSQ